jgi:hypothetical protein
LVLGSQLRDAARLRNLGDLAPAIRDGLIEGQVGAGALICFSQ